MVHVWASFQTPTGSPGRANGSQLLVQIVEHRSAVRESVVREQEGGLVYAVDIAVGRDPVARSRQAEGCIEQVGQIEQSVRYAPRFYRAGPGVERPALLKGPGARGRIDRVEEPGSLRRGGREPRNRRRPFLLGRLRRSCRQVRRTSAGRTRRTGTAACRSLSTSLPAASSGLTALPRNRRAPGAGRSSPQARVLEAH